MTADLRDRGPPDSCSPNRCPRDHRPRDHWRRHPWPRHRPHNPRPRNRWARNHWPQEQVGRSGARSRGHRPLRNPAPWLRWGCCGRVRGRHTEEDGKAVGDWRFEATARHTGTL